MNRLAAKAEMAVRVGRRIKLDKKEFCKIIPERNPVFYRTVRELGSILEQAKKTEDAIERRKLLPNCMEINYLKTIVKGFIILRRRLNAKERKLAAKIGETERRAFRSAV
jgi:hypothetical protein